MLATPEQLQCTLALVGEEVNFLPILDTSVEPSLEVRASFVLKAIPFQNVYNIQGYNSPADADKQDIIFYILEKDFTDNNIIEQDLFTYSNANSNKLFTFKINSFFLDYIGWVQVRVTLEEIS